jgi:DNA-binding SARP family transcriptional activator/uncharacterized protein HemY
VQFKLLGPLVLDHAQGAQIAVAGARLRVLLAMLLLNANKPVSGSALADAVWDGSPPDGAAVTLRGHVLRLRRILGPEAGARISARAPGYVIEIADTELDVLEFESQCREAGSLVRAERWAETARAARRALDLWRAAPLLDVPSPQLHDRFGPPLERRHMQVLEDRIEADLHLGQWETLIPELRDLTQSSPLREDLHAQLMRALAYSGRRAEALDAYRDAQRVLADQLGVDPGPALRDLHEALLADRVGPPVAPAAASGSAATSSAAGASIPRQLPSAVRHFTGRQRELDALTTTSGDAEHERSAAEVWAIDGMAGIGKTALAINAAHRMADRFPDGQVLLDLHGYTRGHEARSPGEALGMLLRMLGADAQRLPEDVDERIALYRQQLAGTRTLIVLDNAAEEAQVEPLVPSSADCLVLVTSRRRLKALHDARILSLDVLPPAHAAELMSAVAGRERVRPDDPALAEIIELCGALPLALRISAALLLHRPAWTLEHLVGLLRDANERIRILGQAELPLEALFDLSYGNLSEDEQQVYRRLGITPSLDCDAHALAALVETGPGNATRLLEDLVDHNLLISHAPGRYRLHDLVRLHARAVSERDPERERATALDRMLDFYRTTADHADARISLYPRSKPQEPASAGTRQLSDANAAWTWLRTERPNLLACIRYAASESRDDLVIGLTLGMASLYRTDGPWPEAISLLGDAADATERSGDRLSRAHVLTRRGHIRCLTGRHPDATADLEEALRLYRLLDERLGQANALTFLGQVRLSSGQFAEASEVLEEARALYREADAPSGLANALAYLGEARRLTADYAAAEHAQLEALRIYEAQGDRRGQANALGYLGQLRTLTGDLSGAAEALDRALSIRTELGNARGRAMTLTDLAQVRLGTGDYRDADEGIRAALEIYRELGDQRGQGIAQTLLGQAQLHLDDHAGAVRNIEEALALFRLIGADGNELWALNHYALAIAVGGDPDRALALHRDALRIARELDEPDEEALALEGIGVIHLQTSDVEGAVTHLKQAQSIFDRVGMRTHSRRVEERLGQIARQRVGIAAYER